MAFIPRRPGAIISLLLISTLCSSTVATNETETPALPTFGDVIPVLGAMDRTDQDFRDGLALDILSPRNRTLVVYQNTSPLPAQFVTGTTGEPFIALSNYSYIIKMNESAVDLIAKVEIPYDPAMLALMDVQESNTYVATLSDDKKSWVIDDSTRNVHRSENNTRIIKMTSIDGEYLLVGRKTVDTANIFVQYGQGATRTVNFTGGSGVQQAEFIDGFRFSVEAGNAVQMNVELKNGISPNTVPLGMVPLNSFSWFVNTSNTNTKLVVEMRVPFNRNMLVDLRPAGSSPTTMLTVAKRALNATSEQYMPLNPDTQVVHELTEDRISVPGLTELEGQYILLVRNRGTNNVTWN